MGMDMGTGIDMVEFRLGLIFFVWGAISEHSAGLITPCGSSSLSFTTPEADGIVAER